MFPVRNLKDIRKELPELCSIDDYNSARKKNLKSNENGQVYWTCVCGSRKFYLSQGKENVKAICVKCGQCDIIYWNGSRDSSSGRMRRLDTNSWVGVRLNK
jgi:hypothetical protein